MSAYNTYPELQLEVAQETAGTLRRIEALLVRSLPAPVANSGCEPDRLGAALDLITACKKAAIGDSNDTEIGKLQETVEALIGLLPEAASVAAQDRWDNYDPDEDADE